MGLKVGTGPLAGTGKRQDEKGVCAIQLSSREQLIVSGARAQLSGGAMHFGNCPVLHCTVNGSCSCQLVRGYATLQHSYSSYT